MTQERKPLNLRYIVIAYDKDGVTIDRRVRGAVAMWSTTEGREVLYNGRNFGDVVKALERAFQEEMETPDDSLS